MPEATHRYTRQITAFERLALRFQAAAAELVAIEAEDCPTAGQESRSDDLVFLLDVLLAEIVVHPLPSRHDQDAYSRFCGWLLSHAGTVLRPECAPLIQRLAELTAKETV